MSKSPAKISSDIQAKLDSTEKFLRKTVITSTKWAASVAGQGSPKSQETSVITRLTAGKQSITSAAQAAASAAKSNLQSIHDKAKSHAQYVMGNNPSSSTSKQQSNQSPQTPRTFGHVRPEGSKPIYKSTVHSKGNRAPVAGPSGRQVLDGSSSDCSQWSGPTKASGAIRKSPARSDTSSPVLQTTSTRTYTYIPSGDYFPLHPQWAPRARTGQSALQNKTMQIAKIKIDGKPSLPISIAKIRVRDVPPIPTMSNLAQIKRAAKASHRLHVYKLRSRTRRLAAIKEEEDLSACGSDGTSDD